MLHLFASRNHKMKEWNNQKIIFVWSQFFSENAGFIKNIHFVSFSITSIRVSTCWCTCDDAKCRSIYPINSFLKQCYLFLLVEPILTILDIIWSVDDSIVNLYFRNDRQWQMCLKLFFSALAMDLISKLRKLKTSISTGLSYLRNSHEIISN